MKIICCKNFFCCWHLAKNFYSEIFTLEFFPVQPFQLDKKPLHIKVEVCERNSCVCVTIATRDVVTGEERVDSLNVKLER